ncbi:methylcrotonoyl-CoA carboxylase subunit alpha, mitochondrial [Condylostylus longicornis]|uniref:methylcrotonoyl-CoA carboxylase subunit alpha, mitochondrial n=1 Tax=Condylostylus longicornis TaxID=2530218 RepID=UPI00244E56F7|nr:methylcrotonoyl-CoA carboxylase subunit alpha, mitochondrial [Condylostylus longicornis]
MFLNSFKTLRSYSQKVAFNPKVRQTKINKILIANRGEIACRVVKTAKRLGVRTVAIYSDADVNSMHTKSADEAYHVGKASSQESYLKGEKILDIAKYSGCQAIHPGYGFLSENVEFAELCEKKGVIFMGPPSSAIRDMGIKSTSKAIMDAAGVPIIRGYHGEDQSNDKLLAEADKIGFPLMIKAVRGGGGKGMRIVHKRDEFLNALDSARNESSKAFGDSAVLLEKFVSSPRHVEVQVFGDMHGNYVYLFERDCSVQRRHQKIIEEAPAPGLSEDLRKELGEAAVRAARAVNYVGAGTVEFILDKNDLSFHFMEMNTRLQVEHPITEMITGTDLVEWQIKVAEGGTLPLSQEEIIRKGHAFEARIYAENPRNDFLPGAGPLKFLSTPLPTSFIRIETGVQQGDEVSVHYDPMIAKLVVWGNNRDQALNTLIESLGEYQITGLDTNINFLIDLASHSEFQAGNVHTGFIAEHMSSLFPELSISEHILLEGAGAILLNEIKTTKMNSNSSDRDPFASTNMRINHDVIRNYKLIFDNAEYLVTIKLSDGEMEAKVNDGKWKQIKMGFLKDENERFSVRSSINGFCSTFTAVIDNDEISVFKKEGKYTLKLPQPKFLLAKDGAGGASQSKIVSPMPGVLEKLFVKAGDSVKKGDQLAVIIAMKMEHVLKAPKDAKIKSVSGNLGKNIAKNESVVVFED